MKPARSHGSMHIRFTTPEHGMRQGSVFALALICGLAGTACDDGSHAARDVIKVFKSDGSRQCESAGTPVEAMAQELTAAGIDVLCGQKGDDGLAHLTVCGAETGAINVYSIHAASQPDAEALGFAPVSDLTAYQDEPCVP
jgi:hypothetical protein